MHVTVVAYLTIILAYYNETVWLLNGFRNFFEVTEFRLATFVIHFVRSLQVCLKKKKKTFNISEG